MTWTCCSCGEMHEYTWSDTAWSGRLFHKETSWWFSFFKSQEKHIYTQLSPIIHHIMHRSHRSISLFINTCLLSIGPGALATAAPSNIFGFILFTTESAKWDARPAIYQVCEQYHVLWLRICSQELLHPFAHIILSMMEEWIQSCHRNLVAFKNTKQIKHIQKQTDYHLSLIALPIIKIWTLHHQV